MYNIVDSYSRSLRTEKKDVSVCPILIYTKYCTSDHFYWTGTMVGNDQGSDWVTLFLGICCLMRHRIIIVVCEMLILFTVTSYYRQGQLHVCWWYVHSAHVNVYHCITGGAADSRGGREGKALPRSQHGEPNHQGKIQRARILSVIDVEVFCG